MKILVTTSSYNRAAGAALDLIEAAGAAILYNPFKRKLSEDEAHALFSEHDPVGVIAGVEPLTDRVIGAAPSLKTIIRLGSGMDSVDAGACTARKIHLDNTPSGPTESVAELTLGLMLGCLRQIPQADRIVRGGGWKNLPGNLLTGRTVGIVGYGRIGRRLADLLAPFRVKILAYDPYLEQAPAGATLVDLDTLLAQSDLVSLHLAASAETKNLLSTARIAAMKPGAILLNVSRGGVVDEAALGDALRSGKLAAAALDVFEEEPYAGPLREIETLIMTSHMGSSAAEARRLMEAESAEKLHAALKAAGIL